MNKHQRKLTKMERVCAVLWLLRFKLRFIKRRPALLLCKEFLFWNGEGLKKALRFSGLSIKDFEIFSRKTREEL